MVIKTIVTIAIIDNYTLAALNAIGGQNKHWIRGQTAANVGLNVFILV